MKTRFNFPTRILFGQKVIQDLPAELETLGCKRPLLITDNGLKNTDLPDRLLHIIEKGNMTPAVFDEVIPNPTDAVVEAGAEAYRKHNADSIVALGGGSPIDTGRAVQLRINHHDPLETYDDLLGGDSKITGPIPPLVACPTTSGTGSEVSRSAVITIKAVERKVVLFSARLIPTVALCDPELTYGLPARITAETGMDALSHNLEAYLSSGYNPMADSIALKGIEMVGKNLTVAVENGKDELARQEMMMASTMGAIAFQKGLGVLHSLSHSLSGVTNISHGIAISIMMPHTLAFNEKTVPERVSNIANALGADNAVNAVRDLAQKSGLPLTLSEVGVKEDQLPLLVEKAMADGCHGTNPRACTASDMEEMFKNAF